MIDSDKKNLMFIQINLIYGQILQSIVFAKKEKKILPTYPPLEPLSRGKQIIFSSTA